MATTTNFGWETPDDTDLVKDGALAMRTLGNGIDTSFVDLKGGTTGQVLSKTSNTDLDFTWVTTDDANAIQNAIVDAKGDLIAASAADTPARLAVGNNGETLVADSSATTGLRYNPPAVSLANPIINGGFDIWQRGTSIVPATSAITYTSDRWGGYRNATGSTISRQTTSDTTNLPNIQYAARVQRDSGNTSTADIFLGQSIETTNSIPFTGKTVTLSFYARSGANFSASSSVMKTLLITGTGTDQNAFNGFTGAATPIDQNVTLTTTWQRFAYTVTLATSVTQLAVRFSFTPVGTAGANDWFEVTGVQLDVGTWTSTTAPTFRRSSGTLAGEFLACQRYFQRFDGGLGLPYPAYSSGTTLIYGAVQMPIKMRSAPSITVGGTLYFFNSSAEVNAASPTVDFSDMYSGGGRLRLGGYTGLTSGLLTLAYYNTGHISLSSEL
jgi:hypothetical protein